MPSASQLKCGPVGGVIAGCGITLWLGQKLSIIIMGTGPWALFGMSRTALKLFGAFAAECASVNVSPKLISYKCAAPSKAFGSSEFISLKGDVNFTLLPYISFWKASKACGRPVFSHCSRVVWIAGAAAAPLGLFGAVWSKMRTPRLVAMR